MATKQLRAPIPTRDRLYQYVPVMTALSAIPNDQLQLNVYFAWAFEVEDSFWYSAMRASVQRLVAVAKQEGIYVDTRYPNYAATGTSPELLYGVANAGRLNSIRNQVDPSKVMDLAGGFNI